jgi:hypothetical protein
VAKPTGVPLDLFLSPVAKPTGVPLDLIVRRTPAKN